MPPLPLSPLSWSEVPPEDCTPSPPAPHKIPILDRFSAARRKIFPEDLTVAATVYIQSLWRGRLSCHQLTRQHALASTPSPANARFIVGYDASFAGDRVVEPCCSCRPKPLTRTLLRRLPRRLHVPRAALDGRTASSADASSAATRQLRGTLDWVDSFDDDGLLFMSPVGGAVPTLRQSFMSRRSQVCTLDPRKAVGPPPARDAREGGASDAVRTLTRI